MLEVGIGRGGDRYEGGVGVDDDSPGAPPEVVGVAVEEEGVVASSGLLLLNLLM